MHRVMQTLSDKIKITIKITIKISTTNLWRNVSKILSLRSSLWGSLWISFLLYHWSDNPIIGGSLRLRWSRHPQTTVRLIEPLSLNNIRCWSSKHPLTTLSDIAVQSHVTRSSSCLIRRFVRARFSIQREHGRNMLPVVMAGKTTTARWNGVLAAQRQWIRCCTMSY